MPDFGIFRGFNDKLFGDKLYAGQLPINLGLIGSQDVNLLLLDLYPNAAAAYSLRKLRSAYTGSAIRVRRTDLQELDIGFISTGELDTTALLAFTGTGALDNGFVTTWYDQSVNSRNALQTSAINQPLIVSSGSVLTENSKPCVNFTSTNKRMKTINNNLNFDNCTISYVCRSISTPSTAPMTFGYGNQLQTSKTRYLGPVSGNLGFVTFGLQDFQSNIIANNDTNINLYSANYLMSTNLKTVYKNQNSESNAAGTQGTTTTTAKFAINEIADRNESATINFSEGVFYDFDNNSNLVGIRANQNIYYGIY